MGEFVLELKKIIVKYELNLFEVQQALAILHAEAEDVRREARGMGLKEKSESQ